jgi:hypothetical protein
VIPFQAAGLIRYTVGRSREGPPPEFGRNGIGYPDQPTPRPRVRAQGTLTSRGGPMCGRQAGSIHVDN